MGMGRYTNRPFRKMATGRAHGATFRSRGADSERSHYRKRGSASYIVREVLSVRERDTDRERERDRDGSDVIIVALKLAMSLHFPLPKFALLRETEVTSSLSR